MSELDRLLTRLATQERTPALLDEARQALHDDPRIPHDLRDPAVLDDGPESARLLLSVLRGEPFLHALIGPAVATEAGDPHIDLDADLGLVDPPLAQAIPLEAGAFDGAAAIMDAIGAPQIPIDRAVERHAGDPDIAGAFPGLDLPIARAIERHAGSIDITSAPGVPWATDAHDTTLPVAGAVADQAGDLRVAHSATDAALPIAEALTDSAGPIDLGHAFAPLDLPVEQAVTELAGTLDIADAFAPLDLPVEQAVTELAGTLDIADAFASLDLPVEQAVTELAGTLDIADAVMAQLRSSSLVEGPLADERATTAPAANNHVWGWVGVALVAVALLAIVGGRFMPVAELGSAMALVDLPDFASSSEVHVEDLSYGQDASAAVIPFEDDEGNGVLVIWVEEESGV